VSNHWRHTTQQYCCIAILASYYGNHSDSPHRSRCTDRSSYLPGGWWYHDVDTWLHGSLGPPHQSATKRHHDRFSRFCRVHVRSIVVGAGRRFLGSQPAIDINYVHKCTRPTLHHARGYLPSRTASPLLDRFQFNLLVNRRTCVWTTCLRLLSESGLARTRTRVFGVASLTP